MGMLYVYVVSPYHIVLYPSLFLNGRTDGVAGVDNEIIGD